MYVVAGLQKTIRTIFLENTALEALHIDITTMMIDDDFFQWRRVNKD